MQSELIEIQYDGQIIKGVISKRQEFHINVVITDPYICWSESLNIPSFAKPNPKHFLTERGDEVAKELLLTCYLKVKEFDGRWSAIVKMHNKLKETLKEVKNNCTSETYETTNQIFLDYWEEFVFESDDEFVLTKKQDIALKLMIETYNVTGKKSFKQ